MSWATNEINAVQAAKDLAHEVEFAKYHRQPIVSYSSRSMEYLASLLRELAKDHKGY